MNALTQSLKQSQAFAVTAREDAVRMKDAGVLGGQLMADTMSGFGDFRSQSRQRQRYGLFGGWVYSAINALASKAAGQPVNVGRLADAEPESEERGVPSATKFFHLNRMTSTARSKAAHREMEILEDHALFRALERPNFLQHRWQFVYSFVSNLNITGWSYIVLDEGEDGELEMWSLPTTWVVPDHSKGPFYRIKVRNPGKPGAEGETFERGQFAVAYLPDPSDPLSAKAPMASQINAIRIDDHIQTSQERFFENAPFPSVIFTVGKQPHPDVPGGIRPRLSAPQRRQVYAAIKKTMAGVANYGNPAIIDGLIERIDRLSAAQNEMGWEKSEDKVRDRILSAFCVPPYILGAQMPGSYAAATITKQTFYDRVNTFLDMLGTMVSGVMEHRELGLLVWWDECKAVDEALRSREIGEARRNNDITRNERRTLLGFPPAEEEVERSKLLDTVGGMTGYTQIMNNVGQGFISAEAGVQALVEFLQIPEERARAMVGEPDEQTLGEAVGALNAAVQVLRPKLLADRVIEAVK